MSFVDLPKETLSPTDITTALGYSPVNKAGDTMTGALGVPSLLVASAPITTSVISAIGNQEISYYGANYSKIYLQRASGTSVAPTAVGTSATVGTIELRGYDGTDFGSGAMIRGQTTEAWSASAHGMKLDFSTVPNGSTTPAVVMTVSQDAKVGIGISPSYQLDVRKTYTSSDGTTHSYFNQALAVTANGTGTSNCGYFSVDTSGSSAYDFATVHGVFSKVEHSGSGTMSTSRTMYSNPINSGGGTVTNQIGQYILNQTNGTSNTTATYGVLSTIQNNGTGTITTAYGISARIDNLSTGAITTGYGVHILGSTGVTTAYGVYQAGISDKNFFAANIGLGYSSPQAKLHIDAGTATASSIKFTANTTTGRTSTDGFDLGITTTGEAEIRQRENLDLAFYTNNAEVFRLKAAGNHVVPTTVTAAGTTGAQTINKVSGTVNFAAGASSLVVTNSLVSANSIVIAVVRTNDTTALIKNVVPGSGSFTINLNANATTETSVGFFVIN